jgi:hypothetical protein
LPSPRLISLGASNQYPAGAIRPKSKNLETERNELSSPRHGVVRHSKKRTLPVGADPLAGIADKFFDVLPTQGLGLSLPSGHQVVHSLNLALHKFIGGHTTAES